MQSRPILISPSLLSCDFARLADEVRAIEDCGADWLHVDVMDGHFVPNLTLGPPVVESIHRGARAPLDVHLMITDPVQYAPAFAKAGAHVLTFHTEVAPGKQGLDVVKAFRAEGVPLVGVSLNPDTELASIEPLLETIDLVLIMSVHPGFGGQSFIEGVLEKTRELRRRGYAGYIEMDGGLKAGTIERCAAAGADVLVSGSGIFGAQDRKATIEAYRKSATAVFGQDIGTSSEAVR